jgi:hypothetical protein
VRFFSLFCFWCWNVFSWLKLIIATKIKIKSGKEECEETEKLINRSKTESFTCSKRNFYHLGMVVGNKKVMLMFDIYKLLIISLSSWHFKIFYHFKFEIVTVTCNKRVFMIFFANSFTWETWNINCLFLHYF